MWDKAMVVVAISGSVIMLFRIMAYCQAESHVELLVKY